MSKKPDDASRIAGLANILQASNRQKAPAAAPPPSPAPPPADAPASPEPQVRSTKRSRVGKYRDPNWHHYGVYLRKDTHKKALRRLEDGELQKDMSELLQELLEQWLASD